MLALHRVEDHWEPITDTPDASPAQAIERCLDDVIDLLRGLEGLIVEKTAGLTERLGDGPSSNSELLGVVLQGLGIAIEELERRGDEPGEWEPVELPEMVAVVPVGGGNEDADEPDLAPD